MNVGFLLVFCLISNAFSHDTPSSPSIQETSPGPPSLKSTSPAVLNATDKIRRAEKIPIPPISTTSKQNAVTSKTPNNCPTSEILLKILNTLVDLLSEDSDETDIDIDQSRYVLAKTKQLIEESLITHDNDQLIEKLKNLQDQLEKGKLPSPLFDKRSLRQLSLNNLPGGNLKTKIVFKYELPSINQPNCKEAFLKLIRSALTAYKELAKYPLCQPSANPGNDQIVISDSIFNEPTEKPKLPLIFFNDILKPKNEPTTNNEDNQDYINISKDIRPDTTNNDLWLYLKKQGILNNDVDIKSILANYRPDHNLNNNDYEPKISPVPENKKDNQYIIDLIHYQSNKPKAHIVGQDINENGPSGTKSIEETIVHMKNPYPNINIDQPNDIAKELQQRLKELKLNEQYPVPSDDRNSILNIQTHRPVNTNPNDTNSITYVITNNKPEINIDSEIIPFDTKKRNEETIVKPPVDENVDTVNPYININGDNTKIPFIVTPDQQKESSNSYKYILQPRNPEATNKLPEQELNMNFNKLPNQQDIYPSRSESLNNNLPNIHQDFITIHQNKVPTQQDTAPKLEDYYTKIQNLPYQIDTIPNQNMPYNQYIMNHNRLPYQQHRFDIVNNNIDNYGQHVYGKPELPHGMSVANLLKLNPMSNKSSIIELTYLLKRTTPLIYQPVYYIKYRLPYVTFINNLHNLVSTKPYLRSDPMKLYQELINKSNVTEVSPALKGYGKEDILKLIFNNGALVKAKLIDDNVVQDEHLFVTSSPPQQERNDEIKESKKKEIRQALANKVIVQNPLLRRIGVGYLQNPFNQYGALGLNNPNVLTNPNILSNPNMLTNPNVLTNPTNSLVNPVNPYNPYSVVRPGLYNNVLNPGYSSVLPYKQTYGIANPTGISGFPAYQTAYG